MSFTCLKLFVAWVNVVAIFYNAKVAVAFSDSIISFAQPPASRRFVNQRGCQHQPNQKLKMASRQICTFEESDFALPTGEWPYTAADLGRLDNSDDINFYDSPRFVTHID